MSIRPLRLVAAALLALGAFAQPALAGNADTPEPGTRVDMPILVAPMIVNGKLKAYAYISSTIVATSPSAAVAIRLKTPFLRDAFVRDVNGKPIVDPASPDKMQTKTVRARLLADARRVMGPGKVDRVIFTQVQISPFAPGGQ